MFHPDHGTQERHAVILQPHDPSQQMELFLNNPEFEQRITYINGNPMMSESYVACDLISARTCILLSNKNSKDPVGMDHKNILFGLAVKKYIRDFQSKNPKIVVNPDGICLCM